MTTINASSKTSIVSSLKGSLSGSAQMAGQAGTLVRKLIDGKRLSAIEQNIVAATGLVGAVADLYNATGRAQSGATGLVGVKNTADVFLKTRNVMNKAAAADRLYAERYNGYGKASQTYHGSLTAKAVETTRPGRDFLFNRAADVVTVAGLGLSAAALPGLTKKVATSFSELGTLVHDPNATTNQRLDKFEELTRASAGTVFSAQGVVVGTKGVANILSRNSLIASGFAKVGTSPVARFITSPIGKLFNVLLPVADGAVLVGEVIATRRAFSNPDSTNEQKFRKVVNLSLAALKTSFWIFPQVRFLRSIYNLAGIAQLGITLWDLRKDMGPKLVVAAKTTAWAVAHPIQAAKRIGNWFNNTVGAAARWTWDKVSHPGRTLSTFTAEAKAWYDALVTQSRTAVNAWLGPKNPAPGTDTLLAAAPAQAPNFLATAPVATAPAAAPTVDAAYQAAAAQISALG